MRCTYFDTRQRESLVKREIRDLETFMKMKTFLIKELKGENCFFRVVVFNHRNKSREATLTDKCQKRRY